MKRLAIYFFFDKDGIVGDYAIYYLKELKKCVSEIAVVVNGKLNDEGRKKFESVSDKFIIRENIGFDSAAYKEAIISYGFEKIKEYDELLLCNFTCYGPVYPFKEMFDEMDNRKCDFWGINRHPEQHAYIIPYRKDSYIREHIQMYFIVIRNTILRSKHFKEYWDTLEVSRDYNSARVVHELKFTNYFETLGFTSDSYVNFKLNKTSANDSVLNADEQLINNKNPLIKRKVFFIDNRQWIDRFIGHSARDVMEYVDKNTSYDVNLIWDDLLRTQNMSTLRNNLHLNYILSSQSTKALARDFKSKVALIIYIYYEDCVEKCANYAKSMPTNADIFIIVTKKEVHDKVKKIFKDFPNKIEIRLKQNRGRDVSALLVSCKDVMSKYDYICFIHCKKSVYLQTKKEGETFAYHCLESVLHSKKYVHNIIETFEANPRQGLLVPPIVQFGPYWSRPSQEWSLNFRNAENLLKDKLKLNINLDTEVIAPFGTMFWFRSKSFRTINSYDWTNEDFPEELHNNKTDGTEMHVIERLYGILAQHDGYYTAWVSPDKYASIYMDDMYYKLREIYKITRPQVSPTHFSGFLDNLKNLNMNIHFEDVCKIISKYIKKKKNKILKKIKKC
ncbi:MAG: rhamnan synthesis F family protein [Endomicrobium sp.]|jgi:rhamnosyltransferase|nr:rhamnan synthesis F family protein [Endomicrobium sp.]